MKQWLSSSSRTRAPSSSSSFGSLSTGSSLPASAVELSVKKSCGEDGSSLSRRTMKVDPSSSRRTSPVVVRASSLVGGSFSCDGDVRLFGPDTEDENDKGFQQLPLSLTVPPIPRHRCLSLPYLSEISGCDDDEYDDEGCDNDSDSDAGELAWGSKEAANANVCPHNDVVFGTAKPSASSSTSGPSEEALRGMLDSLSADELEIAARSSYAYAKLSSAAADHDDPQDRLDGPRWQAARQMAARHWVAEKGDATLALRKMRQTLRHRPRIDAVRECFMRNDNDALEIRRRVRHYLGPDGRMFVRGYDREGRAVFHFIVNNSPRNQDLAEGCVDSHYYILEKAFACTERRSHGRQSTVIVSVDFAGFQKWQAPPLSCVREMLDMLQHHYPERLHRVYLVHAPRLFLCLWNLIKPFVDPHTKSKFQFVDCMEHVLDPDQAMPYQRPDGQLMHPVNMDDFYQLPYDLAYDE